MFATEAAFVTFRAIAAATLMEPLDVLADGVPPAALEPDPPPAAAVASAYPRSPEIWPSALLGDESGAPAALAVAVDDVVDGPNAVNVTALPAVRSRSVSAVAV